MQMFPVLLKKEWLEACRSYRILWMPAFFILLGAMQPLTMYYMEDLLMVLGGLPEGTQLAFPDMSAVEIYSDTIAQFSQVGILAVVLGYMGMFANERKTGEAMLVLAKPVSYFAYWFSKWTMAAIVVLFSYAMGLVAALYYIQMLYGGIPFTAILSSALVYGLWLLVIISITLGIGTFLNNQALTAISSVMLAFVLMVTPILLGEGARFTPGGLLQLFEHLALGNVVESYASTYISVAFIFLCIIGGGVFIKKTDWTT